MPPLYGLPTVPVMDPPNLQSLAPASELRAVATATWAHLAEWRRDVVAKEMSHEFGADLIALAEARAGRTLATSVMIELLPIAGTKCWHIAEDASSHSVFVIASSEITATPTSELLEAVIRVSGRG